VVVCLEAPLNRAAIRQHYPSIDRLHGWIKEVVVVVRGADGHRLGRIRFDGGSRVLCIDTLVRGSDFLLGKNDGPVRDRDGLPVPLVFELTRSQRFGIEVKVTTALFRLGRLRLGSYRLPESTWDLRFNGDERGDRAEWVARVSAIEQPRAPLKWLLPLERIFAMFKESFRLRVALAPQRDASELHDLEVEYGLETPRSALLDFAEALLRWGSRSSVFRDLLGLWHDLAESLAEDLEKIGDGNPVRPEPPA
jgi:hypothetical protein